MTDTAAIIEYDAEFLRKVLQLPEGAYIDAVFFDQRCLGVVEVRVRGMGQPVKEGERMYPMYGMVTTKLDADGFGNYKIEYKSAL